MKKNKALFMDLDHTIIRPLEGRTFPKDIHDWEYIPGVLDKMARYTELGYLILVVSNQGGIEQGYQTVAGFTEKMLNVQQGAKQQGAIINNYLYCISNDKDDVMRKPNPGMGEMLTIINNIDLENSIMVGDLKTDWEFAINANIHEFYYIDNFLKIEI